MEKTIRIGVGEYGNVFCKIEIKEKEGKGKVLSISGVEGPKPNGDCKGSCGQIVGHIGIKTFAPGWDQALLDKFTEIWQRWHLNDMRAACEHQRGNTEALYKKLELVEYDWSDKYHDFRRKAEYGELTPEEYFTYQAIVPRVHAVTIGMNCPKYETEEAKALLSEGWIKEGKKETKSAKWVRQSEHPEGYLSRTCQICGYKYGSAWLFEELPQEVIAFLESLPVTDMKPAWV